MLHVIGGKLKRKKLKSPKGMATRPTSSRLREALFNICQQEIEGARFLDLFAGSGAMGIEALSRGAKSALFVDDDRACIQCIRTNLKDLCLEQQAKVIMGDAIAALPTLGVHDMIYADPPYIEKNLTISYSSEVLRNVDRRELLAADGILFIEDSKDWQPDLESLQSLCLKSSRRIGRSTLHQFVHRER